MEAIINNTKVMIVKEEYASNGRTALIALDIEQGGLYTSLTTNIPDIELHEDEVVVDVNAIQQTGVDELIQQGVFSSPLRILHSGFVDYPICKILI